MKKLMEKYGTHRVRGHIYDKVLLPIEDILYLYK